MLGNDLIACLPSRACRVAIQEAERWNVLLSEMRRSLAELDLGLKGDLTMTEPMVGGAPPGHAYAWARARIVTSLASTGLLACPKF